MNNREKTREFKYNNSGNTSTDKSIEVKKNGMFSFLSNNSTIIIFGLSIAIIFLVVMFFMYKYKSDDKLNNLVTKYQESEENNKKMNHYIEQMQGYINSIQEPMQVPPSNPHKITKNKLVSEHKKDDFITDIDNDKILEEEEEENLEKELIDVDAVTNALRKPDESVEE